MLRHIHRAPGLSKSLKIKEAEADFTKRLADLHSASMMLISSYDDSFSGVFYACE